MEPIICNKTPLILIIYKLHHVNLTQNFPIILNICGQVRYVGPNLDIYASYINVFSAFLYKKEFGLKYTTDNGYFFEGNIMKQKIIG